MHAAASQCSTLGCPRRLFANRVRAALPPGSLGPDDCCLGDPGTELGYEATMKVLKALNQFKSVRDPA